MIPRCLAINGVCSRLVVADRGLTAGSGSATTELRILPTRCFDTVTNLFPEPPSLCARLHRCGRSAIVVTKGTLEWTWRLQQFTCLSAVGTIIAACQAICFHCADFVIFIFMHVFNDHLGFIKYFPPPPHPPIIDFCLFKNIFHQIPSHNPLKILHKAVDVQKQKTSSFVTWLLVAA